MTAQEIQQKRSQGEWKADDRKVHSEYWIAQICHDDMPCANREERANAHAITTAVNNTYGKGLDPEQYMPLRNAAAALYAKFSKEEVMTAEDFEELNNVLAKTIIEPNKVLGK